MSYRNIPIPPPTVDEQHKTGKLALKAGAAFVAAGAAIATVNSALKPDEPTHTITVPSSMLTGKDTSAASPPDGVIMPPTIEIALTPPASSFNPDATDICAGVAAAAGAGIMVVGAHKMWSANQRRRREKDTSERGPSGAIKG